MVRKAALTLILLIGISAGFIHHYLTKLPELEKPIRLGEAWALTDGGSLGAYLVGQDGQEFHFGVRGDLYTDRKKYPLYYTRYPALFSYQYSPDPGSDREKEFLDFLSTWMRENNDSQMMARLEQRSFNDFDQNDMKIVIVYEIYRILRDRN